MGQMVLLPMDLDELIPADHLVRVVNQFVDQMDLAPLIARYKGGGTSSYHPKMMLKVFVYAYTQKIYSSRRIAKALRENIPFLWLSGLNQPDFRTVNRFRGEMLKGIIEEVFLALLKLLIAEGYVQLEDYFADGTKVEANANRYTAVWAKNTERYEKQLAEKVAGLMVEIEQINQAEDARYGAQDLAELGEKGPIDPHKMQAEVAVLNQQLQAQAVPETAPGQSGEPVQPPAPVANAAPSLVEQIETHLSKVQSMLESQPDNKQLQKAARSLQAEHLPRAKKYAQQREKLAGRNSYAKTDPDATFMRMKEDHLPGSQPKAAYNIHNGTENQFVVYFSVHQEAGDSTCLIPHLNQLKAGLTTLPAERSLPRQACADAAYGNEENYAYLEQEQVGNYLKYPGFDRQQKPRYQPNPFLAENMPYNADQDSFTCPAGKTLPFDGLEHRHSKTGYRIEKKVYRCADCVGCPLKETCTRGEGNRKIGVSFDFWRYREQARNNLISAEGARLRKQRGIDVETVFGRIKENWDFRRFLLRGLEKVTVEWGLLCLAHNLAKVWSSQYDGKLVSL